MKKLFLAALAVTASAGAMAQANVYKIDPTHTKAIWEAKHFGTSTNRGFWEKTEGEITLDKAGKSGKVDVKIDMSSINTGVAPFNSHLKGPDFFDVAQHPTARFIGDQFKFDGDKVIEIAGNMTILGKTNPAVLKATSYNCYQHPMLKREVCGGDFETVVKRSTYGLNWGIAENFTSDDIKVTIQVEAIKQ